MTSGIHHVTALTRRVQDNVDFYAGFLGLRLVKRTAGFEDATQLHLFYGDALGSPGSLVTFLVWEDGAPGRVGHGQVGEIALAVPPDSLGDWLGRAIAARVPVEGPRREMGEAVLRLKDPDGIIVKLVGADLQARAPLPDPIAPTRVRGVTLFSERPDETAAFVARFGYRPGRREGAIRRMLSDSDAVDIRDTTGFFAGIPGTGIFDHVAFRAADDAAVDAMQRALATDGPTQVHDRRYFRSLYVRDPAGILFEHATDAPGFTLDEAPGHLGETLFIPPADAAREAALRVMLPQFSLPGATRPPRRDLPFVHRFHHPEDPDGSVILTLHGSAGTEADLFPLAHAVNLRATLLGLRGRATEEGVARWFRRFGADRFDQADIRAEAEAFAAFLDGAVRGYGLDPARLTVLGHSNGANFAAAVMALHPGLIRRAVLLRPVAVLEDLPPVDLSGTRALVLIGAQDPAAPRTERLTGWLTRSGATLHTRVIDAGHAPGDPDGPAISDWMAGAEG
ncbi:VOC family protein [Acidimangrovimonas sediminis]|uniref:VOC family protein n=1 Tax=Acidimangrovimonas sediminis TaxID=2056283 RepID=UPI000C7FB183|nr:VOC family protein [Acidimangrovimonas sediminis]